jgi:error-prone DNA polymerase
MAVATRSRMRVVKPDPRERPPKGLRTRDIYIPDLHVDTIKVKSRNFH